MNHQNGQLQAAAPAAPVVAPAHIAPPSPPVVKFSAILDMPPCLTASTLADRITAAIAHAEAQQESLMAEATAWEKRVHLLRALKDYAGDPQTEAVLAALLPPPTPPKPVLPPPPPQRISECVQVTADLVFVATQTFNEDFTINDVLALMTDGKILDELERKRTRQAICDAMMRLLNSDRIVKVAQGVGRQQSTWRKAALPALGNSHGR